MAAVAPLEKPGAETARRAEPAVPVEPAGVQSLHAQGEPGKTLGLSLRRGHGQLSRKVDGSIAVAALTPISETRRDVNQAPGRHFELLSDQGSLRRSRGGEREYSHVDQSRPRLSESRLPAVEGQADGRDKRRIHRRSHPQESSLKWPICRILAQSRNTIYANSPKPIDPSRAKSANSSNSCVITVPEPWPRLSRKRMPRMPLVPTTSPISCANNRPVARFRRRCALKIPS